jgi:hypothetical protein
MAPKIRPTPAVMAMARAPQNVTRTTLRNILAPPALAANAPRAASKTREPPLTAGINQDKGIRAATARGRTAPQAKAAAEAMAA